MTLAIFPTDPTEMKKMELRSLELIKDCSILSECSADAQTQYYMLKNLTHFRPGAFLYNFESFIDLDIQGISCRVYFGGKVILASASKCDNASYYFAICKNVPKEPKEVLRKVHFDFDSGSDGQSRSKKPYYHLQIGGAFTPRMIDDGVDKSQEQRFNHGLDVPRIFYMPMSLIVLIGMIFREFQPETAIKLFSDNNWRAHLKKCEKNMLAEFHRSCGQKLSAGESLLLDCYYN